MSRVSKRRLVAAIGTLGDLTTEEHELLDGATRDDIGHLIFVLESIIEERS